MRVYLGSDHAGYELKAALLDALPADGHELVDVGPAGYDPEDDYPLYCLATGARVVADPGSLGIVLGGSGNGEQIAANKIPGVRSALVWSIETATLSRLHNDANVLSVGARMHSRAEAVGFARAFLDTAFSGDRRHARRIEQLAAYESSRTLPPLPDPAT